MGSMQTDTDKIEVSLSSEKARRVALLVVSILILWVFINHIAPWMDKRPSVQPLIDFIEENDIDAGALYYTEIEEFAEADIQMNHSMDYTPRGP